MRALLRSLILAMLSLVALSGGAQAQPAGLYDPSIRPPPRPELVPPAPGRGYDWVPGYWSWNGYQYNWVHGRYRQHRPWSYRYVKGNFEGGGGLVTFVPGHFDAPPKPDPLVQPDPPINPRVLPR
ncbi:YXWGXW repeat-containing protein [Limobrevibacterium gyesilva]|uniref:YXWGXW repeat-containing protein n=1 Tax=Limobrevibacterium gyesilva TaxID=2991712 RepID=A0AA41YNG0_9PROT|nr:YXWGXW repeat-containing protein [Limobrevibacterium gyesilva]MCW3475751.1 YXWGXW repeat-containing protein [Limobrevibacterium gyesilva]